MQRILILTALLLAGCTPEDPMIFNPQPLARARWETDDPRDTFPDTLQEPDDDTLTYRQRGIPVEWRDQLPLGE